MTAGKIDWNLTPLNASSLNGIGESGVPVAVEDPDAIKKVVALITKVGGRR